MIIVLEPKTSEDVLQRIVDRIEAMDLKCEISRGVHRTVIGVIGDEDAIREAPLAAIEGVEKVIPVLAPYKLASREFKQEDTVVDVAGVPVGAGTFTVMAGPCVVETREMLLETAREVKKAGASILRGGAFKPRTSPYSFQGLGEEALKYLAEVRDEIGLPIVTEVMDTRHVELVARYADLLQIGARNMQNFTLLKEVGKVDKPILLKRGMSATVRDLLLSAEYVLSQGNRNVILCERGMRTFEDGTRSTLDIACVPSVKTESHLPIIVDPSHAAGRWNLVSALARAAAAAGAWRRNGAIQWAPVRRPWSRGWTSSTASRVKRCCPPTPSAIRFSAASRTAAAAAPKSTFGIAATRSTPTPTSARASKSSKTNPSSPMPWP